MPKKQILVSIVLFFLVVNVSKSESSVTVKEEEGERISALPGQPKVSFQQFSGYVTVNKVAGRALFYWLTEASNHPLSKPLVIWLNGGKLVLLPLLPYIAKNTKTFLVRKKTPRFIFISSSSSVLLYCIEVRIYIYIYIL